MPDIHACELPANALLRRYLDEGAYADCYRIDVAGNVSQPEFVEAFYTTAVFKLERRLLAWFASRPSTDQQARDLAHERRNSFAAWNVEARVNGQLLMADMHQRTRSWLMCVPAPAGAAGSTRLYFGSAVVPLGGARSGKPRMGFAFRALLGFHKLYSRVLLRAAVTRLAMAAERAQR
ncbi:hypothetical protein [Ideonella sp.]|uniref:hypothetical protein n=1 Tax=Ideonella sp. TaxID=1929293 RepID=UPI0035AE62E8